MTGNFLMGPFETSGIFLGGLIRWALPTRTGFVPLAGVGFGWPAFSPILDSVAEPMMCLLPFVIVVPPRVPRPRNFSGPAGARGVLFGLPQD